MHAGFFCCSSSSADFAANRFPTPASSDTGRHEKACSRPIPCPFLKGRGPKRPGPAVSRKRIDEHSSPSPSPRPGGAREAEHRRAGGRAATDGVGGDEREGRCVLPCCACGFTQTSWLGLALTTNTRTHIFFFFCPESLAKAERAGEAATAAAAQGGEWAWEAGNHHQGVCGTWSVRDVRDGKRLIGEKEGGGREGLESGLYGNGRKGHRQS